MPTALRVIVESLSESTTKNHVTAILKTLKVQPHRGGDCRQRAGLGFGFRRK